MYRISLLFLVVGLLGCKAPLEKPRTALLFTVAEAAASKADALTTGDEVGVFAAVEGTENYFLDNKKYVVNSDGQSLSSSPAVYYPEAKQAVAFAAYLPFGGVWNGAVGTFSVPVDQSTTLKQADLCWAKASSTPVVAPVALEFAHKMARLLVQTNTPTEKITIPNAFSGGALDIRTGTFTNTLKSSVSTSGTELILPEQTVTRLILTVAGVEYIYDGSISLETAKTTTVNLTLNPTTKTATLSGSSTTNWVSSATQGDPTQAVSNTLIIHWPKCHPKSGLVDKVMLRIKDQTTNTTADYTVSSGITYANQTFTVPFASTSVFYPYTIEDITLYRAGSWLHESTAIKGGLIAKKGACVLGVAQPLNPPTASDYVQIGNIYWAKGNLVAVSNNNNNNNNECKVGALTDHGLYFQFGSLVGFKGGALANGGSGVGSNPYTGAGTQWWNGAGSFSWANDAMVWPSELVGTKSSWTNTTGSDISTLTDYYFNYSLGWATAGQDIRTFAVSISGDKGTGNLASGRYAKQGVGDPCTYYLGGTWRLPSGAEYAIMCNNQTGIGTNYAWSTAGGSWVTSPVVGGNFYSNKLFFPASGNRNTSNGAFNNVISSGSGWSSSVNNATYGLSLNLSRDWVYPQYSYNRPAGFPVRCVSPVS